MLLTIVAVQVTVVPPSLPEPLHWLTDVTGSVELVVIPGVGTQSNNPVH
jgi:hypothetical protein